MAPPTRSSRRVRKRVNYKEIEEDSADEVAQSDGNQSDDMETDFGPKLDKQGNYEPKAKSMLADDSDHESGPKRKRTKLDPSLIKIPDLPRDIWLMIFDELIARGDPAPLTVLLRVNKRIGSIAAEALYRVPAHRVLARELAEREVSIFLSLTPGRTIYTYHTLATHVNPHALCVGIFKGQIDSEEVYKSILGIKPGAKGLLLPVQAYPFSQLADRVNSFIANLDENAFPRVHDLSLVTVGTGIALPTVFVSLVHLSVEAVNLNVHFGDAVALGCPKLTSLAISFPGGGSLGTRRGVPMPPWTGPSSIGMPFKGAMDFLDALPPDKLTNFEMGLWTPTPMPKMADTQDSNAVPAAFTPKEQQKADHLREVGLEYEPSRMLLRSLARHTKIKSLGLMRMDPEAYVDLPLLVNLEFSLEKLYIFFPDRIWGNILRHSVPTHFKNEMTKWVKSLKLLRSLRWVSVDDRHFRGWGAYWAWTEILAYSISRDFSTPTSLEAPNGLQGLKELHLVLGHSLTEIFKRIENLGKLEIFQVDVEPQFIPSHNNYMKVPSNVAPHALALSIVKARKLKAVTINYHYFGIGSLFFPWPCTSYTARRGVTSAAPYVRSLDSKVHPDNHTLRKICIKGKGKVQTLGLWKFLTYFPDITDIILDVNGDFDPDDLYRWVRATDMDSRDDKSSKVGLYFPKPPGDWTIPVSKAKIIKKHVKVKTETDEMSEAIACMPHMGYSVRSLKFA